MIASGILDPKLSVTIHHLHLKLIRCQTLVALVAGNWPLGTTSEKTAAHARGCSDNTRPLVRCPCQTGNVLGSEFVAEHHNEHLFSKPIKSRKHRYMT